MDKKRGKQTILFVSAAFILLILFFSDIASASFTKGNLTFSINEKYSPKEKIKGWINISLESESVDSLLETNFGDKIKLIDFLYVNKLVHETDFRCAPSIDCSTGYRTNSAEDSKTIQINAGEERLIAFAIENAAGLEIKNFILSFNSNARDSCENQLEVDILDNKEINWQNNKLKEEDCYEEKSGCYSESSSISLASISAIPYCEKIKLKPAPGFKLGVWLKSEADSAGELKIQLYDGNLLRGECNLSNDVGTAGRKVYCNIRYNVFNEKDYYVCIKSNQSTNYKIKIESESPCGFNELPQENINSTTDYSIFARALKYNDVSQNEISINIFSVNGEHGYNLTDYLQNYIDKKYKRNCEGECVIPIRLKSKTSQTVVLQGKLSYDKIGARGIETSNIYNAEKVSSNINMNFIKLDIEKANFSSLSNYGNSTLSVSLGNNEIFSKTIFIKKLPIITGITPINVPAAVPTKLFVIAEGKENGTKIVEYKWEFENNETKLTTENNLLYTFSEIGEHILKLTIKDSNAETNSRTFVIHVLSPKEAINETLNEKKERFYGVEAGIKSLPAWQKNIIAKNFNIEEISEKLQKIEAKYRQDSTDKDYTETMSNLSEIKIPLEIKESETSDLIFFDDIEKIDLKKIQENEENDTSLDSKYKEAILNWFYENIEARISHKIISVFYEDSVEDLATFYKISINTKPGKIFDYENYLVIEKQPNQVFFDDKTYKQEEFSDAIKITFENSDDLKEVEFGIAESLAPDEIAMYISPSLEELTIEANIGNCNYNRVCEKWLGENSKNCYTDCFKTGRLIFLLVLLLIFTITVYIILQEWYKKRYESYLFKNKNDIFNLANFTENAQNQGLQEKEIIEKLKKAGWKSEQISYVIKRLKGKRTGMLEIPILNWLQKAKLKKGMKNMKNQQKRQPIQTRNLMSFKK